ncbi:hypothetical protein RUM43_006163, partial [Polyplax serrata]
SEQLNSPGVSHASETPYTTIKSPTCIATVSRREVPSFLRLLLTGRKEHFFPVQNPSCNVQQ